MILAGALCQDADPWQQSKEIKMLENANIATILFVFNAKKGIILSKDA